MAEVEIRGRGRGRDRDKDRQKQSDLTDIESVIYYIPLCFAILADIGSVIRK